jgi:prepilin-type N-terminal cleavage/methylation domain-containing protein
MTSRLHYAPNARMGFTLVELMVVLVILSILGSLTLAGLNVAQQRSKIAATKTTISKLNEIILPQYNDYLDRRVALTGTTASQIALSRLTNVRSLLVREMPDSWDDVFNSVALVNSGTPAAVHTATVRAYAATKAAMLSASVGARPTSIYGNAECLYLIISRSGFDPYAIEQFRSDEVGDADGDGALEFQDGWKRPIRFLRWAPGFSSDVQPTSIKDPFDPSAVSGPPPDAALVPLIFSAGPNGSAAMSETDGYGITGPPSTGWAYFPLTSTNNPQVSGSTLSPLPGARNGTDWQDNITNHGTP